MAICALCKKDRVLIRSHLIPKAAYKVARSGKSGDLVKVITSEKVAFYSDEQVVTDLLCESCEDLFSKKGEKVLGECWGTSTSFPLLDLLTKQGAMAIGERFSVYDPNLLPVRLKEALFYFAVSVFWRANVWSYNHKYDRYVGALGDKYEAQFRKFLLGETELSNCYLLVTVNDSDVLNGLITFPVQNKISRAVVHVFDILGIKFAMVVGGHIPSEIKIPFEKFGSDLLILTSPLEKSPDFIELVKYVQNNVAPRGRLLKEEGPFGKKS